MNSNDVNINKSEPLAPNGVLGGCMPVNLLESIFHAIDLN